MLNKNYDIKIENKNTNKLTITLTDYQTDTLTFLHTNTLTQ